MSTSWASKVRWRNSLTWLQNVSMSNCIEKDFLERIYRQIELADIIIADMSGKNPNVFYEVGYAHAKQKLCILLTANADDIPFDLKHQRHIVYGESSSRCAVN